MELRLDKGALARRFESHRTRFPGLSSLSTVEEWRRAKSIVDDADERAEQHMRDAFGCHGELIADAISEALWGLSELLPEGSEPELRRYLLGHFETIGDRMSEVRESLDNLLECFVNAQRRHACHDRSVPDSSSVYATEHGVDLNTTLEQAFELGWDAACSYFDDECLEDVSVTLDDL